MSAKISNAFLADIILKYDKNEKKLVEELLEDPFSYVPQKYFDTLPTKIKDFALQSIADDAKNILAKVKLTAELQKIIGVGPKLAENFYASGVRKSLDLLRQPYVQIVPEHVRRFVEVKIEQKIPRAVISQFEKVLSESKLPIVITGSYRRGAKTSSDIDIIVKRKTSANIFLKFLRDRYNVDICSKGESVMMLVVELKKNYNVRVDVFFTSAKMFLPMLLYSTGSKEFNITMRAIAKKHGMLLNQEGLFKNNMRIDVKFTTEQDYFDALGMDYKSPEAR